MLGGGRGRGREGARRGRMECQGPPNKTIEMPSHEDTSSRAHTYIHSLVSYHNWHLLHCKLTDGKQGTELLLYLAIVPLRLNGM